MIDELGDRMKAYEAKEASRKLIPLLPVMVRIDGRSFSKFTKKMKKPFDERMSQLMVDTTKYLCEQSNADLGYVQSDEISLVLYSDSYDKQIFFNLKIQKLVSQLAALATGYFINNFFDELKTIPTFDCRVWNVPNQTEASNTILWRFKDAVRNSVSGLGASEFSHKQLFKKSQKEIKEMLLKEKVIDWNNYPEYFKFGTFVQKKQNLQPFTIEELQKLPEKHLARTNPGMLVMRQSFESFSLKFDDVLNKNEFIFNGVEPLFNHENINN